VRLIKIEFVETSPIPELYMIAEFLSKLGKTGKKINASREKLNSNKFRNIKYANKMCRSPQYTSSIYTNKLLRMYYRYFVTEKLIMTSKSLSLISLFPV